MDSDLPEPRLGLWFLHRHWLDTDTKHLSAPRPAVCRVTRIDAAGRIYYRVGTERRARLFTTRDRWAHSCLRAAPRELIPQGAD